ncbi:MAG: helix-turn-helix transcriptional regulator [Calditrichaeota bacterium]|nr:helix-turn-helix transcriptional regulator [Calditrichota bacterium]MCB9368651.1 helix-turn-helix transcriptional regulator [Calditrichota bacterium]
MEIGARIRNLRLARNLTQEELAERADLTKGFISQLERDQTSISVDSLIGILKVLDIKVSDFFKETQPDQVVFNKIERISIAETGAESFELLIPGGADREMEAALVTLEADQQTYPTRPYQGEAFGFVMSGTIQLVFGNDIFSASSGASFYFSGEKEHFIRNAGKRTAEFLWVTTPPTF